MLPKVRSHGKDAGVSEDRDEERGACFDQGTVDRRRT